MASITIVEGIDTGRSYTFDSGEVLLGRHRGCQLVLNLSTISRRHARIFPEGGDFLIEDMRSLNGTYVNGQRIKAPRRLSNGDTIRINRFLIRYVDNPTGDTHIETSQLPGGMIEWSDEGEILASLDVAGAEKRAAASSEAKLRAMLEITRCIENTLVIDEVLPKILDGLSRVFHQADRLCVFLADTPDGQLRLRAMKRQPTDDETPPNMGPISRTIADNVMRTGHAVLSADASADTRFRGSDSVQDWEVRSMMCAPLAGQSGRPLGVIHVDSRDAVRQFEQADLDVLAIVATLAGQAVEHSRLHGAYLQAERLSAIGQMMTGLAHESRNALQRIQANLERLSFRVDDQPGALDIIGRIQDAQDQLLQLYEQVQGYAAPINLERTPHDIGKLLNRAWDNLDHLRRDRKVTLDAGDSDPAGRLCDVDALAIERVFVNLLENAIAATEDPVEIRINWLDDHIAGAPALRIAVHDNGPGIGAEQRRQIFDPFFTTKTSGTGLGLALTRRYIEAHGGWVNVADVSGPGATFLIALPRSSQPLRKTASVEDSDAETGGGY